MKRFSILEKLQRRLCLLRPRGKGSDNQCVRNSVAWQWVFSVMLPALAGFAGVLVGAWLTARRERERRRYSFIQRQLQELYSPLLGLRLEIRLRSELRNRLSSVADTEWKRLCQEVRQTANPIGGLEHSESQLHPFYEHIEAKHDECQRQLQNVKSHFKKAEGTSAG